MSWKKLRAEAFGHIGIRPAEFYDMDYDDFILLREGWNDKLNHEQSIVRKSTMLILSGLIGGRNVNVSQLWPMQGDPVKPVKMVTYGGIQMTERQMKKLIRLKEQNG